MIEIHRDASGQGERSAYDQLYRRSFSGTWTGQMDSRYLWLVSLLRARPGQRLLDVSCGNGYLLKAAARKGLAACGLEFSTVAIAQALQMAPGAQLVCGDAEALPFASASFDYVTNIGSVEHYAHPATSIAEMARALKPDGLALILVPNIYGLFGNILYVWRRGDVFVDEQPLQRYATRGWWSALIEAHGLVVQRTLRYERELPRTWRDLLWHLTHPTKLVRALISPLVPLNLTDCFVFLCRRRRS